MKTNIDLNKDFTMSDVMSTEFFLYFKEYIKKLSEDQKIAKRDRKDAKHPCPDQRKYSSYQAYCKVLSNRWTLNGLYEIYYFMKKNREFDWSQIKFVHKQNWKHEDYIDGPNLIYSRKPIELNGCKLLNNSGQLYFNDLVDVIKEYVNDGK